MNLKKIGAFVIPTIIAVAIIAYMLYSIRDDLFVAIDHAVPAYLIIAVLICFFSWILRGLRYKYILEKLSVEITLFKSIACIFISQTANMIIPARLGDLLRLFIIKHESDATYSNGLSSIVAERFFDIVIVALLGVVTMPFILNVPEWFSTVIGFTLAISFVFVIVIFALKDIHSSNRFIAFGLNLIAEIKKAYSSISALFVLSSTTAVIWLMDSLICYVIALMFNAQIPFIIIVLAIVIGNLVKAVPVTPGGIGTYEIAVALTLAISGTPAAVATIIAVIDHLVKNVVTLVGGVVSLYIFGDWSVDLMKRAFSKGISKEDIKD